MFITTLVPVNIPRKSPVKKASKNYHYPRLSRKKFLGQVGIIMSTAPLMSAMFGAFKGRYSFHTRHVELSFPNVPASFDGFKIVHISDLHLGSFGTNREPLKRAFDLVNSQNPDLILFTGDLVNNFAAEINGWEPVFAKLKAPFGKYAVLGNHDYGNYNRWKSPKEKGLNFTGIVNGYNRLGFSLLRDEAALICRGDESIGLAGVENWGRASYPRAGDLEKATKAIDTMPFKLLMTHDPDHWDQEVLTRGGYDLTLSGHTHGMQFGIERGQFRWSPAQYMQQRWAGLYKEGNSFLYVNRGLGYHGIPARVGMPPEITVINLKRGAQVNGSVSRS